MPEVLIDTDILSEILKKKNAQVIQQATSYLAHYGKFEFSEISRYEILRGLKEKAARKQIDMFTIFCQHAAIFQITPSILDLASDLWVDARKTGQPCSDPDLIIAATAVSLDRKLITGNQKHFDWIPSLETEDWRMIKS